MKRLMTILIAAALVTAAWCDAAETARRRRPRGRPSGGLVTKEYAGRRILVAVNAGGAAADGAGEALEAIRRMSRLPVFEAAGAGTASGGWDGAVATAKRLVRDGAAAAVVVADGGCPSALVAAPEEGWAVVDAEAVSAGADAARVRSRMAKELWRGVAYALGVGSARSCVTGVARAPAGLDLLPPSPAPDTLNRMLDAASARGAGLLRFATYRAACAQGWAPAPTNDVQRAIWDEVRSEKERGPARAIKIVP